MAQVKAFRGWRYCQEKVGDISELLAPPWDVISEQKRLFLKEKSPYNIIHLIDRKANPVTVSKIWRKWRQEGIFQQDRQPCFYFLRHLFSYQGNILRRDGFLVLVRLEDFSSGIIRPHEQIFTQHRDNRLKLIEHCRTNFSPVFLLYEDKDFFLEEIGEKSQLIAESSFEKDSLMMSVLTAGQEIATVEKFFQSRQLFIADGHHRYQAALAFARSHPEEGNQYVLAYLTNICSPAVIIAPTHRYIRGDFPLPLEKIQRYFEVETTTNAAHLFSLMNQDEAICFGLWEGQKFFLLKLKDSNEVFSLLPQGHHFSWRKLNCVIFNYFLLPHLFGIHPETEARNFFYDRDPELLIRKRQQEGNGIVFFLPPIKKEDFSAVVSAGEIMPQKSTYFFPKVPSGLVINYFGKD